MELLVLGTNDFSNSHIGMFDYGWSSIPWWCYLIILVGGYAIIKKRWKQKVHDHAFGGNLSIIKKRYHSKGRSYLESKDTEGRSPLHHACVGGSEAVATFLVENGADINARDNYDMTPILQAVFHGHTGMLQYLIENGADRESIHANHGSILDVALMTKQEACVTYLKDLGVQSQADQSSFIAAATGDLEAMKRHLSSNVDVNKRCPEGNSLLNWAVERGDNRMFDLLLSNNADIRLGYAPGGTLLDFAIHQEDKYIAHFLIENNAPRTCGRCSKKVPHNKTGKIWRFPLSILKWVGALPRNEVGHVFCHRCQRNQNVCVLFLAAMIGSVILIFIFELIRNLLNE